MKLFSKVREASRLAARAVLGAMLMLLAAAAVSAVAAKPPPTPNLYRVLFVTSCGDFTVQVKRKLAPHGADRFYDLVKSKYFDGARFYRVVPGFVVQWGYAADPALTQKWAGTIPDDKVAMSNERGTIAFAATSEPNSRSQEVFISYGDNARLDALGFAPFGTVVTGMDAVDRIYAGYGERPDQTEISASGNAYLAKNFPKLDYIKTARIVQ